MDLLHVPTAQLLQGNIQAYKEKEELLGSVYQAKYVSYSVTGREAVYLMFSVPHV